MEEMFGGMMNGMLGKVAPGMCRLSMRGGIAIKTGNGYKTYDPSSERLMNCCNFVFPIGEEFFFVIPTNRLKKGDIILAAGKPKYVLETGKKNIRALNYEDGVVETIMPERYLFMGNTYLYGKIVSMFGNKGISGGSGVGRIMKYMMLSQMMKGSGKNEGQAGNLLPMMLLFGKADGLDSIFDPEDDDDDADETDGADGADRPLDLDDL